MKYANETHKLILDKIQESGYPIKYPIMLTADQFATEYSVSCNYMGTGAHIKIDDIDLEDIKEINLNDETRIVINRVWEAKL